MSHSQHSVYIFPQTNVGTGVLTCSCFAWSLTVGTDGLFVAVARGPEEFFVGYGQMLGQAVGLCAFEVEGVAEGIVKGCK